MAYVITDNCVACGTCLFCCPVEAISEGDIYTIDPDTCIDCGTCADGCPCEAISSLETSISLLRTSIPSPGVKKDSEGSISQPEVKLNENNKIKSK